MVVIARKNKGGRPKLYEHHKGYSYVNKAGKTIHVKGHKERYTKHTN
jgi:hypothetical protein